MKYGVLRAGLKARSGRTGPPKLGASLEFDEEEDELSLNRRHKARLLSPGPLLHKSVEEREMGEHKRLMGSMRDVRWGILSLSRGARELEAGIGSCVKIRPPKWRRGLGLDGECGSYSIIAGNED